MDYLLEQLGPERFQTLAQALLVAENPGVQCLPIAERDGGRDAFLRVDPSNRNQFIVFQVKYVRNPDKLADPHKWLVDTMKEESPKVIRLLPEGAVGYRLITNVKGTAYPRSGSIDSLDKILQDSLSIPAQAWWRDEINRRLDNATPAIKWSYPEILRGTDILQLLLESELGEERARRTSAIRAFVADQFGDDEEVRFKQIELQNDLLSLFVDVPGVITKGPGSRRAKYRQVDFLVGLASAANSENFPYYQSESGEFHTPPVGAAALLLDETAQQEFPFVVVQGAPGQGKSTLAQFLCQVYRMKIKGEPQFQRLASEYKPTGVRLPIKVDLTEYAAWLSGVNPFADPEGSNSGNKIRMPRQLESFIAALITKSSGGSPFGVDDLHAVLARSHVLLVLDGLDEVADIRRRSQAIQEISSAARRLLDLSPSIQIVITTRPSAFTGVTEFSSRQFFYLELVSLSPNLIKLYTNNWTAAKKLSPQQARSVRTSLQSRLRQPHLKDLSRNPMQLAILLSVIHSRGDALPDKRTALYELYVDLFLTRESEKSSVVREHRDLLIDVHCYLAWVLQAQAEANSELGRIDFERLMKILESYLTDESRNPELAQELFEGAQRVVFLVARVEGTFEFEVQPLREYFAGKYLYETSAYSRLGAERSGTMPDRFDALARNPYWINVTRFFAGFLNKGELPALVDRLQALVEDEQYRFATHPYVLAVSLLSDWVFNQHQRSLRTAVDLVVGPEGLRALAARTDSPVTSSQPFTLPTGAGNAELVSAVFSTLDQEKFSITKIGRLCRLLKSNASREELYSIWLDHYLVANGVEKDKWLAIGLHCGVLSQASSEELDLQSLNSREQKRCFRWLQSARRLDVIESDESLSASYVETVVNGSDGLDFSVSARGIGALATLCAPETYTPIFLGHYERERLRGLRKRAQQSGGPPRERSRSYSKLPRAVTQLIRRFDKFDQTELRVIRSDIGIWSSVVEPLRVLAQENPVVVARLSLIASFLRFDNYVEPGHSDLFESSTPLCTRTRMARLRAGNTSWWDRQWDAAASSHDLAFLCSAFALIAGPGIISKLAPRFDAAISTLNDDEIEDVAQTVEKVTRTVMQARTNSRRAHSLSWIEQVSPAAAGILAMGAHSSVRNRVLEAHGHHWQRYPHVARFALNTLIQGMMNSNDLDTRARYWIQICDVASYIGDIGRIPPYERVWVDARDSMPISLAQDILRNMELPSVFVSSAQLVCEKAAFSTVSPLLAVAKKDDWFKDLS